MNDETQKQLLEWVGSAAEKGGTFLEQELPLFAHEVVAWYFWSSIFLCCVFACIGIFLVVLSYILHSFWAEAKDRYVQEWCVAGMLVTFIFGCFSLFGASTSNGYSAVKAYVAPRVVLLDYVKTFME